MKEKELYKIIGNLKPDDCLKARVSSAVESKDNVIKERRPIFVPALMMLLVCVNLGAIAMFFSGDRLNSQWGGPEVSQNELIINSVRETVTMKQQIDDFITEMSDNGENYSYFTYYSDDSSDPYGATPWYFIGEPQNSDKPEVYNEGATPFRRYVQTFPDEINGKRIYTDHEYLVRYDGNGFEYENIVYVIESDSYLKNADDDEAEMELLTLSQHDMSYFDSEYGESEGYNVLMFENENQHHFIRYYEEIDYDFDDRLNHSIKPIPMNDGDLDFADRTDYWKIPDENSEIVMPHITEMNFSSAKEILDRYGLNYRLIFTNDYHEGVDDELYLIVSSYSPDSPVADREGTVNVYLYNYDSESAKLE